MENQLSSMDQINHQIQKGEKENLSGFKIDQIKKNSDVIFEESNVQNMNSNFQTSNSFHQRSSEIVTEKIQTTRHHQPKSIFHNFQKHLVITLRKNIKIQEYGEKDDAHTVAWQIWQNFLKQTKVYTKNILHILFGVVDYEGSDLSKIYDEDIIEKFGYGYIFSKFQQETLTKAQEILRFEVAKQLKKTKPSKLIRKRRLLNAQQFIEYVKEFIGELEEGPMRKRLPKSRKEEMKLEVVRPKTK